MKKNISYIISNIDKAIAFEWIANGLDSKRFKLEFILLNPGNSALERYLVDKGITVKRIRLRGKKDYPMALFKLFWYWLWHRPHVVHAHLFDANIIGLLVAKILGIKQRIYTRHHSSYHHDNFPKAVKWDLRANSWATDIVAISQNVAQILVQMEHVPTNKVHLIHHGFDLMSFRNIEAYRIEKIRTKYKIPIQSPIIGVIARYLELKGHVYIIDAFKSLQATYPQAHLILANAAGPDAKAMQEHLVQTLPKGSYTEIRFEPDLFALYPLFDVYVHTPIDAQSEAFGQTYIEALAAGIPSVFTLSGVAPEFIQHEYNALVVGFKDSNAISLACHRLLSEPQLREQLIKNGKESITEFELSPFIKKLENLYN